MVNYIPLACYNISFCNNKYLLGNGGNIFFKEVERKMKIIFKI